MRLRRSAKRISALIYARAVDVQKKAGAKLVSRPGADKMTMAEIDQEIAAYRDEKRLERR